jgi:DNA-binding transcriptional MerR regulator
MLFKKTKKDMPVPIEGVQKLTRSGLSDRDIIKELKNQGYSYEQIERAMLQAVKAGVGEESKERSMEEKETMESMMGGYGEEPTGESPFDELPVPGELYPTQRGEPLPQEIALSEAEPELIIEELIEGVVEEKWQKFDEEIGRINDNFEKVRIGFEQLKQKIEEKREPGKDFGADITELSNKLENVEARVGGLEKAFKQFLPALTHNIESLSEMVHEMKRKEI